MIKRFPKHNFAIDSYLEIAKIYLQQCCLEFPDTDFLDLAQVNLTKFRNHFPGEPKISEAEAIILEMKEKLAKELYEISTFYEKTKKPAAAIIYYSNIIKKYPETSYAKKSTERLEKLQKK